MDTRAKIISLEQAAGIAALLRAEGRRLILVDGCFDILQAGHARTLARLRSNGAALVVAVYEDATVAQILGRNRPVLGEQARAQLVAALAAVDYVIIWPEARLDGLLDRLHPDCLEHAADERNIIGEILERHR